MFYPHDRPLPSEEIAVSLETGTLLLHKHGHDCLLVGASILFHLEVHSTTLTTFDSTKGGKSRLVKNGFCEQIFASSDNF